MLNSGSITAASVKEVAEKSASAILSRLAEKMTGQTGNFMAGYSRMHNRHNRS